MAVYGVKLLTVKFAQDALARLKDKVDALVVIPNDRIFAMIDKDTPAMKAFGFIDEVLKNAVKSIAELINMPGIINVDFADIETTLKDAGTTLIGIGVAGGQDRGVKAAEAAINSPLLEVSAQGAKGVLFSIAGGKDLKMSEINDIARTVASNLDQNARVIFGAYYDRGLKDKMVKVTVIATGFQGVFSGGRMTIPTLFVPPEPPRIRSEEPAPVPEKSEKPKAAPASSGTPASSEKEELKASKSPIPGNDTWEVPAFLRRKRR